MQYSKALDAIHVYGILTLTRTCQSQGEYLMSEKYEVAFQSNHELRACDWRWPDNKPVWTMSSREGVQWFNDGQLTEEGRRALLEHFGLDDIAEYPL